MFCLSKIASCFWCESGWIARLLVLNSDRARLIGELSQPKFA
jgi:hypothetical protein